MNEQVIELLKDNTPKVGTIVISKNPLITKWSTGDGWCSGSWHYHGMITSILDGKFYEVTWKQDDRDTDKVLEDPCTYSLITLKEYFTLHEPQEPTMQETTPEQTFTLKQIEKAYAEWDGDWAEAANFAAHVAKFHDPEYQQYLALKAKFG
jgi:hypothetical protein